MAQETTSSAGAITKQEVKHWIKWALVFTLPADLAFLYALQSSIAQGHLFPTGQDLIFAFGAFYSAILSAVIGFLKTYLSDNTK